MKENTLRNLTKLTEIQKLESQQELFQCLQEIDFCEKKISQLKEYLDLYKKEYHENSHQGTDLMMIQSYTYFINNIRSMVEYWQNQLQEAFKKSEVALEKYHQSENFDKKISEKLEKAVSLRKQETEKKNDQLVNDILVTSQYFFKKTS